MTKQQRAIEQARKVWFGDQLNLFDSTGGDLLSVQRDIAPKEFVPTRVVRPETIIKELPNGKHNSKG